jgi:chromatin segregation and condensation protein Rec8/ScpA/Scc1 (kleisin family)
MDEDLETEFDFGEYDEYDEFDELSEYDEAAPRRRKPSRPALKTAARGNPTIKPPRGGVATKAELDATAKKLDARIATNSNALKTLESRHRASEAEMGRISAALKKEIVIRKKQTTQVKTGLDESRQMAMILPLIVAGADPNDKFAQMLPILMYSGALGGSGIGGGGGGGGTGNDNGMMMMALMLTLAK